MRTPLLWLLVTSLLAALAACNAASMAPSPSEGAAEEAAVEITEAYVMEAPSSATVDSYDDSGATRAPAAAPAPVMPYERFAELDFEAPEEPEAVEEEEEMDEAPMRERERRSERRARQDRATTEEVADYRYQNMLADMPTDMGGEGGDGDRLVLGGAMNQADAVNGDMGRIGGAMPGLQGQAGGSGGLGFGGRGNAIGSRGPAQELDNFVVSNLHGFGDDDTSTLVFQDASGYWDNTYLPGDPTLRALHGHLRTIADGHQSGLALSNLSTMYAQPFDPPTDAAMAVYVHSDRAYIDGETRMIVQVGLQGAVRNHGQRPAMNIAVVLDMRNGGVGQRESIEALFESLRLAHDTGDVFSVVVAGPRGGLLIPPGELGYGAAAVAIDQLFAGAEAELSATSLDAAMAQAIDLVSAEDLASPLGSSLVLLATPGLSSSDAGIEDRIHRASVDGVMTSTLALGMASGSDLLDRFALAGQGNRREAMNADEVDGAVQRELAAAGRVVARAVRLRIRLAPGVRLVQVLGSHNLNDNQAQRVRDLERSVDRRLSASLGIEADRGEDEDGIQIVIPAYYAGDAHVFLLDVVAEGPGPIADVTVRYKDLIHLDNAVARDALSVARNLRHQGPLETNVVKNVLGYHLAEALRESAEQLERGDLYQSTRALENVQTMLRQAYLSNSALGQDPELGADLHMIDQYLASVQEAGSYTRQQELAGSLRYAAYLKHQRPLDAQDTRHD